jgi:hypothetical protein
LHIVVDQLFGAAELWLAAKHQRVVRIVREDEGALQADEQRPLSEMRLRSSCPPVTRLTRKVLLGLWIMAVDVGVSTGSNAGPRASVMP